MGMVSVGLGPSVLGVEVDVVADVVVASVVANVLIVDDFVVSFSFVDVVVVGFFVMISILSTTVSTLTFTGISCICTLFTASESSSSMVLVGSYCSDLLSIDLDSVLADPAVIDECSEAGSVVVVAGLVPLVAA